MASPTSAAVRIRSGAPGDAAALAAFGARTFRDAFAAQNAPADMELYLAGAYGEPQQRRELADAGMVTLLAEVEDELAGFAQLRRGAAPACVAGAAPVELWRFYVDGRWQGRGVAQPLMAATLAAARARGAATIWLGVWENNPRAQRFYAKTGFVDVGQQPFVLGTDPQIDRVMARPLGDERDGGR